MGQMTPLTLPLNEMLTLLTGWAEWMGNLSGSALYFPPAPHWALVLCGLSVLGLIYGQSKRLWYVPLYLMGCGGLFLGDVPDVFLSQHRPFIGIYKDKTLVLPQGQLGFPVQRWQQRAGGRLWFLRCLVERLL